MNPVAKTNDCTRHTALCFKNEHIYFLLNYSVKIWSVLINFVRYWQWIGRLPKVL